MSELTTRQLQAQATKNRLIDAALRVFAEKGFVGSTTKDIAREAGVTDGLIYHYFKSKEDLLWAGVEKNNMAPSLRKLVEQVHDQENLERTLVTVFKGLFEMLDDRHELVVMFFGESQRDPRLQDRLVTLTQDGVESLFDALRLKATCDSEYLKFAIRNALMAAVMYFLIQDRFMSDPDERMRYVAFTATQLTRAIS